jgi:hypothetical protein
MHVPADWQILHFNRPLVVEGLVKGICLAFNVPYELPVPPTSPPSQPGSVPTPEPPQPTTNPDKELLVALRNVIYSKWTWAGKNSGWKIQLGKLRELLP